MCFNNDNCDWYADVNIITDGPSLVRTKCWECGQWINIGDNQRHVQQQEHEACQHCWDDPEDKCEEGCCDLGESFECHICDLCCKVLKAIEAVEFDEGCPEWARQPMYGELQDAIFHDDEGRYAKRSVEMFPETVGLKFITAKLAAAKNAREQEGEESESAD